MKLGRARILSIDPISRGFAYVVLEGPERLIDWGVTYASGISKHSFLERLKELMNEYQPDLLVSQRYGTRHGRRNTRANAILHRLEAFADSTSIPLRTVSRAEVHSAFRGVANKYEIAKVLVRFFPELETRLPRYRKPWMCEDERMNVFDALSFVFTVLQSPEAYGKR